MKRYILTGAPGCGKTSILIALEMRGYFVVSEAATDIIAYEQSQGIVKPWENSDFIDQIINLQKQRQMQIVKTHSKLQFYDRSPICTYALATYLGFQPSAILMEEIDRIEKHHIYQRQIFFIENLGFCKPTEARKISFEESLKFEKIHEETYAQFGFECIRVPVAPLQERVDAILQLV